MHYGRLMHVVEYDKSGESCRSHACSVKLFHTEEEKM